MKFLFSLSKAEIQRQVARQRKLRRWFWACGMLLLTIQIAAAGRFATHTQAVSLQTATPTAIAITATHSPVAMATHISVPTPAATPSQIPPTSTPALVIPSPTIPIAGYGQFKQSSQLIEIFDTPTQVSELTFPLNGRGPLGKTILVYYKQSLIAQTIVDDQNLWQVAIPTGPLTRGENVLTVDLDSGKGHTTPLTFSTSFTPWWLDAPIRLQSSLGEGYACAPTVLGMAMDYYHQLDSKYPAPPTTELVRGLTQKGFISGYGADAQMVCNLAILYDYSHSFFYQGWSQAHLRQSLDAGNPIIANVRIGLSTDGYGHSVLVIGLSPDGKRVMLLDPAQSMIQVSWEQFDRSWGSFGPPYRHGTVIKP